MKKYLKLLETEPKQNLFVLENEKIIFYSDKTGVRPLLDFYLLHAKTKKDLIVVDKIMGKGATLLAILVGANKIVTYTISQDALDLAKIHNVEAFYETKVPYILNRDKTGRCPIESALLETDDIDKGYKLILETLKKLANK